MVVAVSKRTTTCRPVNVRINHPLDSRKVIILRVVGSSSHGGHLLFENYSRLPIGLINSFSGHPVQFDVNNPAEGHFLQGFECIPRSRIIGERQVTKALAICSADLQDAKT